MKRIATLAALLVVVSLAIGGLVALSLAVPWGSSTGSASPDLSLTCSVKTWPCTGSEVAVFRMSALSNAHAGTPSGSSYPNVVCCDGVTGLGNTCGTPPYATVLALSGTDNAHVATATDGTYTEEVCLSVPSGPINCSYATTCPDGWACLATISDTTNAHVADCVEDPYETKVCCSDAEPIDCPDPGSVPWTTPPGDADCDGFKTSEENFVGTDPTDNCPDDPTDDAWPSDYNRDAKCNILDIVQWTPPYFNTSPPNPNYSIRKDLNGDSAINILDIVRLTPPMFNTSCTP